MRLPNDTQKLAIYGQNGSGKTVAGLWHLEQRSWLRRPWIIFDFKRDPTIKRIPRLEEIDFRKPPPSRRQPGLYVIRPRPEVNNAEVEQFLWRIWEQKNTGLYVDEGYMIPRHSKAWTTLQTQGRALRIPIITLSQRPAWLNPFVMSEADFHQVMHIQNPDDWLKLKKWVPDLQPTRKDFHSQYYDVGKGEFSALGPVPEEDEILDRFDFKMPRRVRLFTGLLKNAPASAKGLRRA